MEGPVSSKGVWTRGCDHVAVSVGEEEKKER